MAIIREYKEEPVVLEPRTNWYVQCDICPDKFTRTHQGDRRCEGGCERDICSKHSTIDGGFYITVNISTEERPNLVTQANINIHHSCFDCFANAVAADQLAQVVADTVKRHNAA